MTTPTTPLRVEVWGAGELADGLAELGAGALDVRTRSVPDEPAALVVAAGDGDADGDAEQVDVVLQHDLEPASAAGALWRERLGPWAAVVQGAWFDAGPAVLREHDPAWVGVARRRLARLAVVLGPSAVVDRGSQPPCRSWPRRRWSTCRCACPSFPGRRR